MSKRYLLFAIAFVSLLAEAGILGSPSSDKVIIQRKNPNNHIEYYQPDYAPDVWYDEQGWTLTVYGNYHYTYLNYNIYDSYGVCQLSSCIDGGNNLIDLPTLGTGTCSIEFVANNGDTYIGYFTVH